MKITTHILDTSEGRPAAKVRVELYGMQLGKFELLADKTTDHDGRISDLFISDTYPDVPMMKIIFHTGEYFSTEDSFYPLVEVYFSITEPDHYHIPLLISPFGYTTYRGS